MKSQLKISVVISYMSIGANLLVGIFLTPILIRQLGPSEFGIYSLSASIISYLSLFQFGFGATYLRYYVRFESEGNRRKTEELNGMFTIIFSVLAVIAAATGVVLLTNIERVLGGNVTPEEFEIARRLLSIMIYKIAVSIINIPFISLVTANERFVFLKGIRLCEIILRTAIIIPLLLSGFRSVAVVTVSAVLMTAVLFLNIWQCKVRLKIKFRFSNFDAKLFREMGGFTFFIALQGVMDIFNWQMDKFLITRFWGAEQTAVYAVGAQFNSIFMSFSVAITALFVPRVNRIVSQNRGDKPLSDLLVKTGRIQFLIVTFVMTAFIFFGQSGVLFFAGSGYENSYYIALLLMFPLVLPLSMSLSGHVLRAKAKHGMLILFNTGVAFLNFLISIPLCMAYGEVGAAAGTFIGMIVSANIIQAVYAKKVGGLDIKRWFGEIASIFPALIVPSVFGIITVAFIDTMRISNFLVFAGLFTVIYALSIWFVGMNVEEKTLVANPVKKLMSRVRGLG